VAVPLIDAAEGPGIPVESLRATSWLEPGSSAHETFKAVTTLTSVCVALQRGSVRTYLSAVWWLS